MYDGFQNTMRLQCAGTCETHRNSHYSAGYITTSLFITSLSKPTSQSNHFPKSPLQKVTTYLSHDFSQSSLPEVNTPKITT